MRDIKLRVFVKAGDVRQDHAVLLPGDTRCVDVKDKCHQKLTARLGTSSFTVTGVQLYPHWNKENER